jgi:hypothetical protein
MHFHFQLANHYYGGLAQIEDIVTPVIWGLRSLGHRVTLGILPELPNWPSVVLLLEYFAYEPAINSFLAWRTDSSRPRSCVGLICTEDLDDALVMQNPAHPGRRENLLRALPYCDFVWPIVPSRYDAHIAADRLAFLDYGYIEALRGEGWPAAKRDIDVLFYGSINERRRTVMERLTARGLQVAATRGAMPSYIARNLMGRSKIVLDMKRAPEVIYTSPSRICAALQQGATVVSELFDTSRLSFLYDYTEACSFDEIVDRCVDLTRSPDVVERGLAARDRFQRETSMVENLRRAMALPIFTELAAEGRSR